METEHQLRHINRDMETSEEEKEAVRSRRAKRLDQISSAQAYVDGLTTQLRDLNAKHAIRNIRIYESIGIREDHAELSSLPPKFWAAYEDCNTAYTACKEVELKIQLVENEQSDVLLQLDKRMVASVRRNDNASTRGVDAVQNAPFVESSEEKSRRLNDLCDASLRLSPLHVSLESARDKQYEEESKLDQIAEEAFVVAGYFRAVDDSEEIELLRRVKSNDGGSGKENTERRSDSAEPIEQDQHSSASSPDKSALAERVRRTRKNVSYLHKRLHDARWQPLSDAGSMDSDAQGVLRVRRMIKRTGEIQEAEDGYRSLLHRAQNEDAMSEQSDQSSNFRDHISDSYGASTLKGYGFPMAEKRRDRVHNWMSPSSLHKNKQEVRQAAETSDNEGSWIDCVNSMKFGEAPEERGVARWRKRVDMWENERDRLRKNGPFKNAENDIHPQNSGTAIDVVEVDQQEEEGPPNLGEDDNEDLQRSSSDPRVLYNPDRLTADLVDSDRGAAQWIKKHFNGRWKMRHAGESK